MKIFKTLNNNVAVVLDEKGQEKIVMGKGICFQKRNGDEIPDEVIDKTFFLSESEANNKFQVLIQDVPMEHIAIGEEIITEAKLRLGNKLNEMIYISLIDHVHTSIVRFLEGVTVKNVLLWDIRRFYKDEFQVGLWALDLIEEKCKVRLPEDEAGFIALHLANAQMNEEKMHNMYEITRIMQEMVNIVKYYFHIEFDEDDVYYYRFITHLKFFAKRLTEHKTYMEDENDDLWEVIREKYPQAFRCVEKITQFIQKKYDYQLSKEEQLYLTIHIERVINKTGK
ncbi:MAG: PRD domain-containing protein [Faecalicatena sp.]|uniref:BglG family transcription antiterminator LicT n=1 Tax=Faecalicatena sp. TaxID=2005360 RepID=UPI0025843FA8|nr:PRD domain-containing protein [Faecalicatena sp.]MCI6465206.1 PRD domain-containing protein [Faecalicatena sp.]MDY5621387.1 PRD domain-containing protein [Lachnospiraceae bacterium]